MYTSYMDSYRNILAAGGKSNSLGRGGEVIDSVYANPFRLDELVDCVSADDAWVRMRAIDSFEKIVKVKPEWALQHLDVLFSDWVKSSQPSIQWHLAQIFCEVELTVEQRKVAITWLKNRISAIDVDWIVSVNVMKALVYFYQNGFVASSEIDHLFKVQEGHSSKTVRKKAAQFRLTI